MTCLINTKYLATDYGKANKKPNAQIASHNMTQVITRYPLRYSQTRLFSIVITVGLLVAFL